VSAPPPSVHLVGAHSFTRVGMHPFTPPEFIRSPEAKNPAPKFALKSTGTLTKIRPKKASYEENTNEHNQRGSETHLSQ